MQITPEEGKDIETQLTSIPRVKVLYYHLPPRAVHVAKIQPIHANVPIRTWIHLGQRRHKVASGIRLERGGHLTVALPHSSCFDDADKGHKSIS